MTEFFVAGTLLTLVVAGFIVPPLWHGRRTPRLVADGRAANLAVLRDQLAELERELASGTLASADFAQAKNELQRRLLEENAPAGTFAVATNQHAASRKTTIAVLLLLPLLGLAGYAFLGNPRALDPQQTAAPTAMTAEQISQLVAQLAEHVQAKPDDLPGWLLLARSYKTMGRYAEAVAAYDKAETLVNDDPELLASHAEAIAMADGKGLLGKPRQLIARALTLAPGNSRVLFLAGAAAMEAGENQQGIAYWEALLPQVEPGSEIDRMLRSGIAQMKQGQ